MPFYTFRPIKLAAALILAGAISAPSAAAAHPRLVSTLPAANSTTAITNELKLTFSEALVAQFSGMSILMTEMPGMKMTVPMSVGKVTSSVAADGKTLIGTLQSPLPAVPADTHRVEGSYSFIVNWRVDAAPAILIRRARLPDLMLIMPELFAGTREPPASAM